MPTTPNLVNLRDFKKARDRQDAKLQADQNAALHGRTKAQRVLEATQSEHARRKLDQLKFDDE